MTETAEFWVMIAFVAFFALFGKKIYVMLTDFLDGYVKSVKSEVDSAEKMNSESTELLNHAKKKGDEISKKIEEKKADAIRENENLKKYYDSALQNFIDNSEKNLQDDVDFERSVAKKEVENYVKTQVIRQVTKNLATKKFDISKIEADPSVLQKFFKN